MRALAAHLHFGRQSADVCMVESKETKRKPGLEDAVPLEAGAALQLSYGSAEELEKDFAESLGHAVLFVPSEAAWKPGQAIRVSLELRFCDREVEIQGLVAAVRPPGLARTGAVPGVSLQLRTPVAALRAALEQATGLSLSTAEPTPRNERRGSRRGPAYGAATLAVGSSHFPAEIVNVSYEGMLALLHGLDLGLGSEVTAILKHPQRGEEISVESRIVNQTRCDHGKMAVGIQFQYPARRIEEVMAFIDDLQSLQRAKELAQISGSLTDTPLEDVIETLAGASSEGTLRVSRGDEEGVLIHRDGEILHAATGLVSGVKAVSRLLLWREGRFAYQAVVDPFDTSEAPLSIEAALLSATVHRDEAERLGIDRFEAEDTFRLDEGLMDQLAPQLDEIHREIAEHIRMDFPLGAILDMLIHGDGVIYQALAELLDSGVITAE